MAIKKLFDFLKKFDDLLATSVGHTIGVSEAIYEITRIKVEASHIRIRSGIIYLPIRGAEKTEVCLNKGKILVRIQEKVNTVFTDIK